MKTRQSKEYHIRRISIDVCRNDSVDIRCGGPSVLGFDFSLDANETPGRIRSKLKTLLDAFCHSWLEISVSRPVWGKKPWSWDKIEECIRRDGGAMR